MNLRVKVSGSLSFRSPACKTSVILVSSRPPYTLNSFKLQTWTLWYLPKVIEPMGIGRLFVIRSGRSLFEEPTCYCQFIEFQANKLHLIVASR